MTEQWKPIPDAPGYEASDQGRVRSFHRRSSTDGKPAQWGVGEKPRRVLKPSGKKPGVNLRIGGRTRRRSVASLVMLAFIGPRPKGHCIHHLNGDLGDNCLENLRYVPCAEIPRMSNVGGKRKLTDDDVRQIRNWRASRGFSTEYIARRFGIAAGYVSSICLGRARVGAGGPIMAPVALPLDQVEEMRRLYAAGGVTMQELGERFGRSLSSVSRIIGGSRRSGAGRGEAATPSA